MSKHKKLKADEKKKNKELKLPLPVLEYSVGHACSQHRMSQWTAVSTGIIGHFRKE